MKISINVQKITILIGQKVTKISVNRITGSYQKYEQVGDVTAPSHPTLTVTVRFDNYVLYGILTMVLFSIKKNYMKMEIFGFIKKKNQLYSVLL